ncbi:acetyl-CoA carboxylase [Actibacterium sp. MT2.3-13A]|uniref:acetyl-CoA carboxylase n=1 Tax=Actibacterium sp. MT2.3-13A TaxID=2828332 RepID=UPI001BAE3747|nr:acetyl-CoA carboxylase [Actibacterium sp. MT2.3-13A]
MAKTIQSPLPGTFYRRPAPDQPEFVAEGGSVAAGDTIGLIEVMKTFHEVTAEQAGSNIRFSVENEAPVTAGAVLAEMD